MFKISRDTSSLKQKPDQIGLGKDKIRQVIDRYWQDKIIEATKN